MKTVLVVEDEAPIRNNLRRFLQLEGYSVMEAENGRVGLEIIRHTRPDLILCDVMMPELDGFELLKMLHLELAGSMVPFIFLTASAEMDDLRLGIELGADEYLTKPFTLPELAAVIRRRLGGAG